MFGLTISSIKQMLKEVTHHGNSRKMLLQKIDHIKHTIFENIIKSKYFIPKIINNLSVLFSKDMLPRDLTFTDRKY